MAVPSPVPRGKRQGPPPKSGPLQARSRRQRKKQQRAADANRGNDSIIDLTFDDGDSDIEQQDGESSKEAHNDMKLNEAGPSRNQSLDTNASRAETPSTGKGKGKATATDLRDAEEPGPSAFKPLSRSIMTGWKLSPSRSPSPSQAEIYIDEKPADPDPPDIHATTEEADDTNPTGHFDPPGLFSTALVPSKRAKRTLRKEEKKQRDLPVGGPDDADAQEGAKGGEESLLLPEHVVIESEVTGDMAEDEDRGTRDTEGLHILDDSQARGVTRYFDPQARDDDTSTFLATADQSRICMNCKRPGHNQRDCPHIICPTCGKEDEHERKDCPYNLICFRCGLAGHKIQDCAKPRTKGGACDKCGAFDHTGVVCPTLWRMYTYYSVEERKSVKSDISSYTGWAKEAAGGDEGDRFCYNCAKRDHFGDDCPRSRGSLARFAPSAFSKITLSLGPFSNRFYHPTPLSAQPTHQRWDDDDEGDSDNSRLPGQVTPFAGLNAGKKTAEKRKRAAMEQDRQFGGSEPRRRGGASGGGRGGGGGGGLPFGHRQFMTPSGSPSVRNDKKGKGRDTPQIQFGKLSLPGSSANTNTPSRPPGPGNSASTTLVNRALRQSFVNSPKSPTVNLNGTARNNGSPLASTPKSKRRRRKSEVNDMEEGEIEEIAFRKSGAGGGRVSDWGKEMDEEERKARKVAAAERKRTAGAGAGGAGGLSIKGRSKAAGGGGGNTPGQKYHGGY